MALKPLRGLLEKEPVRALALCVILFLSLFSLNAAAQEDAETKQAALPDPQNLRGDWWSYIEAAEADLPARIDQFKNSLSVIVANTAAVEGQALQKAVQEIKSSLNTYAKLTAREPQEPPPLPTAGDSYTLSGMLALFDQTRKLQLEVDLDKDEVNNRDAALKKARNDLDDLRAAYLELDAQSPQRLIQGVNVIRDRLRVLLSQEELRLFRPRLEQTERRLEAMREMLETATSRIVTTKEEITQFEQQQTSAQNLIQRLNGEAAVYRLRSSNFSDAKDEQAQTKRLRQKLIHYDVRIAGAELTRVEAKISSAFVKLPESGSDKSEHSNTETTSLRETLVELETLLENTERSRQTWRRAADSERAAAQAQLALAQDQDAELSKIHRARLEQTDQTLQALTALRERIAKNKMLANLASQRLAKDEGWLLATLADIKQALIGYWSTLVRWASGSLFSVNDTPVTLLGLTRVFVILAIAWWLSKFVRHALDRVSQRREIMNRASLYTMGRLFHYAILTIGILIGLSSIGLDFTKLALFVSALGVGLGFGLQAVFSNFVAGLMILFERSLKVGDFVELESGVTGEVREINIRSTLITTNDNIDILVPNSEFVNGRVINWTLRDASRRLRVPFGVAYGTDKELVKKAALEAASTVPFTLTTPEKRKPQVWLVEFGDSSLNYELVVWLSADAVSRPGAVHAAYTWELETSLAKYNIEIPFPQRDLHIRSGLDRRSE